MNRESNISRSYLITVIFVFGASIYTMSGITLITPHVRTSGTVSWTAFIWFLSTYLIPVTLIVASFMMIFYIGGKNPSVWERNVSITETSTRRQLFRVALSVIVCYLGTYSFVWGVDYSGSKLWMVITSFDTLHSPILSIPFFIICALGLFPPLYIYAGICYQIGQTVTDTFQKWQSVRTGERLSEKDPEWNDDRIHSPVIVHGSRFDPKNAAAVQLFGTNYILITESLYYDFQSDPNRLAAILSHEQSHIEHTDTLVSSVVPIVAPVFLLSEAAVYAMFDYKSREYRADLWALNQAGLSHKDLRNALDRVSSDDGANNGPLLKGVAATPVKFSDAGSRWKSVFQYFFSPYSVAVHPSLKNRKRTIDPDRERPPEAKGIQPE